MVWELEFDQKQYAIQAHYNQNRPLSRDLQELVDRELELEPFEDFYLRSFWRLVSERGTNPCIPYSKITKYGERFGLDSTMMEVFTLVIWSLDREYSKWISNEQQKRRLMDKPSPAQRAKRRG